MHLSSKQPARPVLGLGRPIGPAEDHNRFAQPVLDHASKTNLSPCAFLCIERSIAHPWESNHPSAGRYCGPSSIRNGRRSAPSLAGWRSEAYGSGGGLKGAPLPHSRLAPF